MKSKQACLHTTKSIAQKKKNSLREYFTHRPSEGLVQLRFKLSLSVKSQPHFQAHLVFLTYKAKTPKEFDFTHRFQTE
ncbi:MAG: hypothetical protein JJU02_03715 [Cryomorphaceae bacterium]|nr:hypothetical protein [Cryomorphaceae bacterium]